MKKLILIIILALFVSGCVGMPDITCIFGGCQKVKEMPEDVIAVQGISVLPPNTIYAGDQFSVSFNLVNLEEEKDVAVGYRLLDWGLCPLNTSLGGFCSPQSEGCNPYNQGDCETHSGCHWDFYGETFPNFVPGQTEFVEWTFDTPSNEQMGYLSVKCPVRFIIGYNFQAVSEVEVNVITDERYGYLKQTGEFTTFSPTLTVGRGPVKLYMELGASLPIRTGRALPVYITAEDKGSGLLERIPSGSLTIEAPSFTKPDCGERFTCSGNSCSNSQELIMISRKSPTIKCSFMTPTDVDLEQTYFVDAYLDYYYSVVEETSIEVKPSPA
jgi:hypothetical protein